MTNRYILDVALKQSAIDSGCAPEDFLKNENVIVRSCKHPDARKYLYLPFDADLTSYGHNIVASVSKELEDIVRDYISKYTYYHCFETPHMLELQEALKPLGYGVCFMAEYFLPDVDVLHSLPCDYELRVLTQDDFATLYKPEWSNALCKGRMHLDVLGVGAYENGELIGLAGCSADGAEMRQIGVDVLPDHRKKGVAASLVSTLACEIIKRGKVPFYCCAWSNVASARTAIKSGFKPVWVQLTVKPQKTIDEINAYMSLQK